MKINILHRIGLSILVWFLSVDFVAGQATYRVERGSVKEYKIDKPPGIVSYTWEIFTDIHLTSLAGPGRAELTPLGAGRENEVQVKWELDGEYYLLVSIMGTTGCVNRMAWHFVVSQPDHKPVAQIAGAPIVTLGHCDVKGHILDASISSGNGLTYSWSPITYLDDASSSTPRFIAGGTTRYHLTVTDSRGQTDTTSVLVVVADPPNAVTDKNVFVETPNANILLNGANSTGTGLTYLWLSKEGIIISGETQAAALVSGLGVYYLQVTDSWGCTSRDSVNVGLYIQAISDTVEIVVNQSTLINVARNDLPQNAVNPTSITIVTPPSHGTASVAADSLVIYSPDELYVGQDDFIYSICDYFGNCDNAKVLVLISDLPFFAPEAFSPNGDGINDRFAVVGLEKYRRVEIEIYNRWGNVVYQSANYGDGDGKAGFWDGTVTSGMRVGTGPVPTGTYYYILKLNGNQKVGGALYLDR